METKTAAIELAPARPEAGLPARAEALRAPITLNDGGVKLTTLEDAYRFAKYVVESGWSPKGMDKPESVLIAMQHGFELGLSPMAALQNIALINGRPGIYGDAALALVRHSRLMESYSEIEVGEPGKDTHGVKVTAKRVGCDPQSETFTVADAKTANLWGKQGPWSQYPRRMLKFRARGFLLRDQFGDVLKGLHTIEEIRDIPAKEINVTATAGLAGAVDGVPAGEGGAR